MFSAGNLLAGDVWDRPFAGSGCLEDLKPALMIPFKDRSLKNEPSFMVWVCVVR